MDARKLVSFDIPTRDNIHRYQCNNPIILPQCSNMFIGICMHQMSGEHLVLWSVLTFMFLCLQVTMAMR